MSAFFCSRGTCNGKLHFQMQRYHLYHFPQSKRIRQGVFNKRTLPSTATGNKSAYSGGESFKLQEVFKAEAARDVQSEGEAAKDYKVEVMVGMSVSKVSMPSE